MWRRLARSIPVLAVAWPSVAAAKLPVNNATGDWASDQAIAAEWFLLTPFTWGWILAALALLFAVWFAVRSWRRPARRVPVPDPADLDGHAHRRWLWLLIAALVLLYSPGLLGDFSIYDDPQNIWLNDVVTQLTPEHLREVLLENHNGVNQEWMYFSFQVCWYFFGRDYMGWFAVNLAMFPLILLLVNRIAWRLSRNRKIALLSVAFLGVSPIYAELLCWMLTRGHYFGLLFGLSSCAAYLEYLEVRHRSGWARWWWLLASVLAFALCQFAKPIYLYVPVWLVLFDIWQRRTDLVRAVAEKVPFAVAGVLFLRKILTAGGAHGRIRSEYVGGSISNTLAIDANQVLEYARAASLPFQTGLRVPWNEPESWLRVTGVPNILVHGFSPLASLIILLSLIAVGATLALRYRWSYLLLALIGSAASLATVMNLPVHTVVMAYRYTLSANVLVSICLAAATLHLMSAPGSPFGRYRHAIPPLLAAAWLTMGTWHTNANRVAWRSPVALWTRSADLYPRDGWAHYYAGKSLQHAGRYHESLAHLVRSAEYLPGNDMVHRRLGDVYYELGMTEEVEEHYGAYFGKNRRKVSGMYERRLRALGMDELIPRRP